MMYEWYDRYGSPEMKEIWSTINRLRYFCDIEKWWLQRLEQGKLVTDDEIDADMGCLNNMLVTIDERSAQILRLFEQHERDYGHEMEAFLHLAESIRRDGDFDPNYQMRWIHFGLTSSDVMDTTLGLQISDSYRVIEAKLATLKCALMEKQKETEGILTYGRTHGQAATTMPFNKKFKRWWGLMNLASVSAKNVHPELVIKKNSGSVGTNPTGCGNSRNTDSQVVSRSMVSASLALLPHIAGDLELIAKEIRDLSRVEIGEMQEGRANKREGSSAMPGKKNPIGSENVCGLARVVRNMYGVMLENIALEHERDLTNSSSERVIIPSMFYLVDQMLDTMIDVMENLIINKEIITYNWSLDIDSGFENDNELEYMFYVIKGFPRYEARQMVSSKESSFNTEKGIGFTEFDKFRNDYHKYILGELDPNWMKKYKGNTNGKEE